MLNSIVDAFEDDLWSVNYLDLVVKIVWDGVEVVATENLRHCGDHHHD